MKTKLCIFDLDFTLYDELNFLKKVFVDNKLIFENDIKFLDYKFRISSIDIINDVLDQLRIKNKNNIKYFKNRFSSLKIRLFPYNNLIYLLTKIKYLNIRIALLTNGDPKTQNNKINNLKIKKYFDKIVFARSFLFEKPDPMSFNYLVNYFSVNPVNVLFIGDSLKNDIKPAYKLGMQTLWLNHLNQQMHNPRLNYVKSDNLIKVLDFIK